MIPSKVLKPSQQQQRHAGSNSPTDGFPKVVIRECPTARPFSQIHWSCRHQRRTTVQKTKPQSHKTKQQQPGITLFIGTLDLSGYRKQKDSESSCSVRPSCFISLRFSIN